MTLDVTALNLRDLTSCGGCAAKADASLLKLLRAAAYDQQGIDTLIGLAAPDDAAVTAINETTSLVTTIDFFPPVVSDPFDYGYVSALNSLSDIYAMGGLAKTALLVCGFPKDKSKDFILENEDYDRTFYTGFLGELHYGDTEETDHSDLFVNLRCMEIVFSNIQNDFKSLI